MKVNRVRVAAALILVSSLFSCKKDHYKISLTEPKPQIGIRRLEKDLFSLDPDKIPSSIDSLKSKYNGFLQLFSYVINTGNVNDPSFSDFLVRFCTDRQNNEAYNLTIKTYPDVDKIRDGLENAFRYYIHYFPEKKVPSVYTCITGFNNSIITGDGILGIGLDRYLGADCEFYPRLEIYNYIAERMTPDYVVPDCLYAWAASEWDRSVMNYSADNLLSEMIHEGKLKYFARCMLPYENDEVIFGFTPEQMNFSRNNEDQMWLYLVEHDLLFTTDQFQIRKFIGEAPFTSYFTNESPGRAAVWIGFRIVESYMMKNPSVSLDDLMKNIDFQTILEKAKYNPR